MPETNRRGRLLALTSVTLIALLTLTGSACARAPQLTRYPYLTDGLSGKATVNWGTDRSQTVGRLTWGKVGSEACTAHTANASKTSITVGSRPEYQWKSKISGLDPASEYCYRTYLGPTSGATDLLGTEQSPSFSTHPAAGTQAPFSFAVIGDWGSAGAGGNANQAAILQSLGASGADFAISSGDIGYQGGSQTNYGDLFQTGTDVSAVFGPAFWPVAGSTIPMYPALGNHGRTSTFQMLWPESEAASSSDGSFTVEKYCCLNGTQSRNYPSDWYAFDVGTARFYVLDASWSNGNLGTGGLYANDYAYHWTKDSAEYKWLKHDLATHPSQVKFATFHFPLYSANATESSDTFLQGANSLEGLLSRYGVDIAFNGHAHIYQRNNSSGPNGLVSYVTGGGGGTPEPTTNCSAVANVVAYAIGWSNSSAKGSACGSAPAPTAADQVYHYLLVSVDGRQVTVTPTNAAGGTFDVMEYRFPPDEAVPDTEAPSVPAGLTATAVDARRVKLDWSPSTDDIGVSGYRVYRADVDSSTSPPTRSDPVLLDSVETDTTYVDTTVAPGTSYEYSVSATDAAGNESAASDPAPVTTPGEGPAAPTFIGDRTASVISGTSIDVPITTTAGDFLSAVVAIRSGATNPVQSVSDSAGNAWSKGPVGFLNGSNTRVEIWFSSATQAVDSVHLTIKNAANASANVGEFTGVSPTNPLDASAGGGNASSTVAETPQLTTTSPDAILIGAINYPAATSATLDSPTFTAMQDFGNETVSGHAAYRIVSSPGTYSAAWALGKASTSGGAIAAFRVGG